jgi:pimeloyl-ACP methyl ester carboxylesterase
MGGYVAFEMHRLAPARIERLALLDTKAAPDTPEQLARRRGFMELTKKGRFKGVTPLLLPNLIHKDHLENEVLRQTIFNMAREVGPEAFLRQQQAIIGRGDYLAELPKIKCPTLVLCGAGDMLTPPEGHREMAALIPHAKLVVVEDAGHLAPLEQPEAVTKALSDWLDRP